MAGKRKELRSDDAIAADAAKTGLQLIQSQAWVNACARSYCLRYDKDTAGASVLSQEATRKGCTTQTTQWSEWLKGKRAVTSKTVENIAKVDTFQGLKKVHEVGPWQASPFTGVGAHVPLWEVLRGDRRSILQAWEAVPKEVWRHWLRLGGDLDNPLEFLNQPTTYPDDDYENVEFAWQAEASKQCRKELRAWRKACREALRRFADGETEVPEDIDDPNWVPPLLRESKKLESEIRSLGFAFTEDPWKSELLHLQYVEDYLRAKRRGIWGGSVDEEAVREQVGRFTFIGVDSGHDKWVPAAGTFDTEAGLCELLRQCVEAGAEFTHDGAEVITFINPPLVILAASITLVKLNYGQFCSQVRLREVLPYRIGFVAERTGWNLDECLWAPIVAELERIGLSLEAFQKAARGYGVELYRFGRYELMEEQCRLQEEQMPRKYRLARELAKK